MCVCLLCACCMLVPLLVLTDSPNSPLNQTPHRPGVGRREQRSPLQRALHRYATPARSLLLTQQLHHQRFRATARRVIWLNGPYVGRFNVIRSTETPHGRQQMNEGSDCEEKGDVPRRSTRDVRLEKTFHNRVFIRKYQATQKKE